MMKLKVVSNYILIISNSGWCAWSYPDTTQAVFKPNPKGDAARDPGINEPCNVKCMIKITYFYCLKTTMVNLVLTINLKVSKIEYYTW